MSRSRVARGAALLLAFTTLVLGGCQRPNDATPAPPDASRAAPAPHAAAHAVPP